MTLSAAYETALEVHNAALDVFAEETATFRAGGCFDAFGKAQEIKKAADAAFDLAFNIEAARDDAAEVEVETDDQLELI